MTAITEAIERLAAGQIVIVADDADSEDEAKGGITSVTALVPA